MNLAANTILITGGASGIGLALAERFVKAGSEVVVCGRRADKLLEAQQKVPGLHTRVCDVAEVADRVALLEWVKANFPRLNVLVNNAGIQRRTQLAQNDEPWENHRQEITINVDAPIHLAMLFLPHLQQQQNPAIINVTSGLAFVPAAFVPIYSATKAALHSFTLSLRHQLANTPVQVLEVVPPAVDTDLGGPGLHTFGVPVDEFADSVMQRLANGETEVGYGFSEKSRLASRQEADAIFQQMNNR
ncbi:MULTISPECIES: SDR family oxidoreductase [Hymenobacter]|uniref:SDR family NAD(P)-dependent oxidoreductase n=1 Tax=Hymenobacter jejuensis TaxID=2502781 RepID=A0A5B7ZUE6_9BACT|nr:MULTISPECIES: SDR family NAD(P)-dependent oxidoreductase [Hymenobacter]MBC6988868.1 SDR family NAD(P)-dependent oxidoreductase [Hymenobacter sp. BT491]QDA58824.1 SDR family NAD(P)-dependent oxidoreductase [Hymenobacter jejuensis]